MKKLCLALLVGLFVPATGLAQSAPKSQAAESRYYPIDRVQVGQKGYGMTVFQGSTPERFEVEVLGVLKGQPNPKQNLIIARLSGGQVDRTRVFAGMSGSPVYLDGKIVGAVAYAFAFATEAIAGITPIDQMVGQLKDAPADMQKATRGDVSFKDLVAARGTSAAAPSSLVTRLAAPEGVSGTAAVVAAPQLAAYAGQTFKPIATPIAFNGIPQSVLDRFAPDFERLGLMAVAGAGGGGPVEPVQPYNDQSLLPGSSVVVSLIRGDFNAGAAGTVTDRVGDRVYAFGHPFLSLGATAMPMAESSVIVVVPNLNNSFKFAQATRTVGAINQDRSSGIGGKLGSEVKMIPVHVAFKNSHGETGTYNYEIINDPTLAPIFLNLTLMATVMGTERQIGDQTVDLRGTIRLAGQPAIALENRFAGNQNAAAAASMSVAQPMQLLMNSGFKGVSVEGVDVEISATEDRQVGTLTRVWVDKTQVGRGETIEVQAFARTEEGEEYVERIPIEIPRDAPVGKLAIVVGDGATLVASDETFAGFAPENLSQLVAAINKLKKNDRLYVKVVRATGGAVVENQPMTALPPSVLSSLGSPRASGAITPLQTSTLFERELRPARFIVTGQQAIAVNVVR
jgi:hypothetical protein